jgi:membrane protease YdiL (CAAX protease family)
VEAPLLSLDYPTRLLLSWSSAALLGAVLWATKRPWHRAAGVAIMTVPLWLVGWNYVNSIQFLADPGSVLPTYSTRTLRNLYTRSILVNVGYVTAGFLLWASGGTWRGFWELTPQRIARAVREAGVPLGRGSEARSVLAGVLAFPVLLFASIAAAWFLYNQPALVQGDETSVWLRMTAFHMLLISLAAGFGEELVYRGVLMVALARFMPPWAAILVQALVFGFAHAGYGTIAHVILPTLFGLLAGVIAYRWGLWAAIVLHVLVDIYAFGIHAIGNDAWLEPILAGFLALNVAATVAFAVWWAVQRMAAWRRQAAPPA